jgi:hypothetical protein
MIAARALEALSVVSVSYDGIVDYGNWAICLKSFTEGEEVTVGDLISSGTIYHVDTSAYTVGERVRQGYVSRSHATNGKIKIDLEPVLREQMLAPPALTLTYPAHRILNVFVDIDLWSEDVEYTVTRAQGLIVSLNPIFQVPDSARVRVTTLCAY